MIKKVAITTFWVLCVTLLLVPLPASKVGEPAPVQWRLDGAGELHLLYRDYQVMTGRPLMPMAQGNAPSCVGAATAKALEIRHGVAFDAAYLYGIARVQGDANPVRPGAHCKHAAEACEKYGVLPAWDMALLGVDLSFYQSELANTYGPRGPPPALIAVASAFKTSGSAKISTVSQLRGAIANGYPAIVGSAVGFGNPNLGLTRDQDGFLRSRWLSRWSHAMVFIGVDDRDGRRGFLVLNSWGTKWISGPQKIGDEPPGTFWVSYSDATRMLAKGDTYVLFDIPSLK